nr:hypothetical protein [Stenotrophomonas geniculata]
MKANAQPKLLTAIDTTSLPPPRSKAARHTEHWSDQVWQDKSIDRGISNHLASIDRVLQAVTGLHRILLSDERKAESADGIRETAPGGLSACNIEDLHNSMELLLQQAGRSMFKLREDDDVWPSEGPQR